MAKAQIKAKEEGVLKEEVSLPTGIKASDLTVEKRVELFTKEFEKFNKETSETFGIRLGVELNYAPQAIVPRLTVIDLLQKKNEKENPATQEKPKA